MECALCCETFPTGESLLTHIGASVCWNCDDDDDDDNDDDDDDDASASVSFCNLLLRITKAVPSHMRTQQQATT